MEYQVDEAIQVMSRTPAALDAMLRNAPETWVMNNNGGDSWSPWAVVGHMLHNEESNWLQRANRILESGESKAFDPVDPVAMFTAYEDVTMSGLLDRFAAQRAENLKTLKAMNLTPDLLAKKGLHPALGTVTLSNLLATWVAHDMNHCGQVVEVLSRHYKDAVGPWVQFLPILTR